MKPLLLFLGMLFLANHLLAQSPPENNSPHVSFQKRNFHTKIKSVKEAFDAIDNKGIKTILKGEPWIANMVEAHVQGVAMYGDYCLLTHNNRGYSKGFLLVVNRITRKLVHKIKTPDENYNHPGGIQVLGDYLLVPVEDSRHTKSFIRFYDLGGMSDTIQPVLLPFFIEKPARASGAVGMTDYVDDIMQYYLLCTYDNGKTDFYRSNGGLLFDPNTKFDKLFSYTFDQHGYSSVCLLTQSDNKIFLIGFRIVRKGFACDDFADLFEIDIQNQTVTFIEEREFFSKNGFIKGTSGVHFRWGGGLNIVSDSKIELLATQRNFVGGRLPINIFR